MLLQWMKENKMRAQIYLGDGVYGAWDGYQLWLAAERDNRLHCVAIDERTAYAFKLYGEKIERLAATVGSFEDVPEQL